MQISPLYAGVLWATVCMTWPHHNKIFSIKIQAFCLLQNNVNKIISKFISMKMVDNLATEIYIYILLVIVKYII